MGLTRFLITGGAACIITALRTDVSELKNAKELMLTGGFLLIVLGLISYGRSDPNHNDYKPSKQAKHTHTAACGDKCKAE
eukprot:XP_001702397.1 predicted protein [Chlamydomonas reinhardtii]